MKTLSTTYLVLETLAIIGYAGSFAGWHQELSILFIISIPFYLATLTCLIWVHPIICVVVAVRKKKKSEKYLLPAFHGVLSIVIASTFLTIVLNGFYITA